ncbi:DUF4857 domain-containing protein [Rhodocista pekingensis]|uniref:DUF4857 domain-containing protein n=1 Tax=Rhodocista pekingensis TaxID=201185 RepID=A0ABW2L0K2_9PROT
MPSVSRLATLFVAVLALCWFLPDLYDRAALPEPVRTSGYYSADAGAFLVRVDGRDDTRFLDEQGNPVAEEAFRRGLPFLYFADLEKHGEFPATVAGVPVTVEEARRQLQMLRLAPRDWNSGGLNLHTLIESAPWGARLSLPDHMFRVRPAGLEFLRVADGRVDRDLSDRFTAAMTEAGVVWPLVAIGGNPSTRKEFDEGYLLVDSANRLFQLKLVKGEPECRATGLTVPGRVRAATVSEHQRREFIGAVVSDEAVHLVTYDDRLVPLPAAGFDADTVSVSLRTDPLNRTVLSTDLSGSTDTPYHLTATDREYRPVHSFDLPLPADYLASLERRSMVASALFPLTVSQSSATDDLLHLHLAPAEHPGLAAAGGLLCCALLWLWRRRTRAPLHPVELVTTLLTGVAGLLALLLLGPLTRQRTAGA